MKIKHFYPILSLGLIALLILTAFKSSPHQMGESETNKDLIKFSHKFHAELAECSACHSAVSSATDMSTRLMPTMKDCSNCHDVEDADECTKCHYEDVFKSLVQKKSELIFNHKSHIEQELDCKNCHVGLDKVDYSFESALTNPRMEQCYACHGETKNVTNACEACHISTANLIPQNHKKANFTNTHKFLAIRADANCVMCHDNNSCSTCHVSTTMLTEKNTPADFYQPYVPSNFNDGTKQQQLTRVHDLNYRFTHGIDLKGKQTQCQSCHQVEEFCVSCHSTSGGENLLGGVVPSSHLKPGFVLFGKGSGGGEHAKLGRRDIERCISCHDVQGQDPTCILCHKEK